MADLFGFGVSPWELVVRGTLMYGFLLLVFRFVLRRDLGSMGVADVLFVVIVADASQNGLSGGYQTISEAFVLVGTLVAWNYALDYAAYRFELIHRLMEPPSLPLVRHGRFVARNLRREFLTPEDVLARLREAGTATLADVREARIESDGKLSVILERRSSAAPRRRDEGPPGAR
jgi:uncharacterized membrane protein YcaP (DUF421 family)